LWCYALSQRRCNGETQGDAQMASEAAGVLLIAGGPLLLPPAETPPPPPPSSVSEAIYQCTEGSAKEDGRLPLPLLLELAEDVETLLGAKSRVLAALSDARDVLLAGVWACCILRGGGKGNGPIGCGSVGVCKFLCSVYVYVRVCAH
jgi:hypothetical protein